MSDEARKSGALAPGEPSGQDGRCEPASPGASPLAGGSTARPGGVGAAAREPLASSDEVSATARPVGRPVRVPTRSGKPHELASSDEVSATLRNPAMRAGSLPPAGSEAVWSPGSQGPAGARADEVTPECPGRYYVRAEKGRGGNGRVLIAVDAHLGREIALKEMFPGADRIEQLSLETRFLREARLAGQLEHPNIVPVYELGRTEAGAVYYTMRLVRGRTLSDELEGCRSLADRLKRLKSFLDLCHAIAFAHSRGVVHRDVKPQNVMVGEFGETVLLDWGLAKVKGQPEAQAEGSAGPFALPADSSATVAGAALGSPAYMSPEQARGEIWQVDELSDVWGLGAVLYEVLTGEAPFRAATATETMNDVIEAPLVPVLARCPDAPPELAAIAEKALLKARGARYGSARELAADVEAFMTGGRVGVYRYSSWELLRRFARENRPAIAAAFVVLVAIVGALIAVSLALREEQAARALEAAARVREGEARAAEHEARLEAELQLARTYLERAERLFEGRRFTSALASAARSLRHNPAHPKSPRHHEGFAARIPASAGLRMRAASMAAQAGYKLVLEPVATWEVGDVLGLAAFSPDGRQLAAAVYDGTVRVWDLETRQERLRLAADTGWVFAVAFSPDGRRLATSGRDGLVRLWDPKDGAELARLEGHQGHVRGLAFSPDGTVLASAGADRQVRLWSLPRGEPLAKLAGHEAEIYSLAFTPDGRTLLSGGPDRTLRRWSVPERRSLGAPERLGSSLRQLAVSPDGGELLVAGGERDLQVRALSSLDPRVVLEGNDKDLRSVAWSPDGGLVATGGLDGTARLWRRESGEPFATLEGHGGVVGSVVFSPDGNFLASTSYDHKVRLWRMGPEPLATFSSDHIFTEVEYSDDGRRLATASWDLTVRVWDLESGRPLFARKAGSRPERALAFSPDGRLLASAAKTLDLLDADTGEPVRRLPMTAASTAAFSPDGRLLATGDDAGLVQLWDPVSGRLERALKGHGDIVFGVAFSPDGRLLASAGKDARVRVWDVGSGECRHVLEGFGDWAYAVAFASDGRLATSDKSGLVVVWDPQEGRELLRLTGHAGWVSSVRFTSDGRRLVTSSEDGTVRVWDASDGRPLSLLRLAASTLWALDVAPGAQAFAVAQGKSVVVYPIDPAAMQADPLELLVRARAQGFLDPEAEPTAR